MAIQNLGRVVGYSILSGAGVPSGSLGVDGDSYLNSTNGDIYSKSGGAWGSPTGNIKGIQGVQGFSILSGADAPTTQGVNGDTYLNTTNGDVYLKASGSWGSPTGNIRGPQGIQGIQGPIGISTTNMTTANRLLGKGAGQAVPSSPAELEPVGITLTADKVYNAKQSGTAGTPTNIISAFNVEGGKLALNTTVTGAIKIKPVSNVNSFYVIKGIIRSYGHIYGFTLGFNPSNVSYSPSATLYSSTGNRLSVRFFNDGTSPYIAIGETTTNWEYLSVSILSVTNSFSNSTLENTANGWEVSLITAFTGTQSAIITNTLPFSNLNQIVSDYVAASGIDTPLTNAMSILQMFQNLQKQNDNRYTKSESLAASNPYCFLLVSDVLAGVLIKTDMEQYSDNIFLINIKGNSYSDNTPIDIEIQGHITSTNILYYLNGLSKGFSLESNISLIQIDGKLCVWFQASFYKSFFVEAFSHKTNKNLVTSIIQTSATVPTGDVGGFPTTTVPMTKAILNNGSASNIVLGDGTFVALNTLAPIRTSIVGVSANKTLALTDENTYQDVTASVNITVPVNATVSIPIGAEIEGVVRNSFTATIVQDSGVTVLNKTGLSIVGFAGFKLKKITINTWVLIIN